MLDPTHVLVRPPGDFPTQAGQRVPRRYTLSDNLDIPTVPPCGRPRTEDAANPWGAPWGAEESPEDGCAQPAKDKTAACAGHMPEELCPRPPRRNTHGKGRRDPNQAGVVQDTTTRAPSESFEQVPTSGQRNVSGPKQHMLWARDQTDSRGSRPKRFQRAPGDAPEQEDGDQACLPEAENRREEAGEVEERSMARRLLPLLVGVHVVDGLLHQLGLVGRDAWRARTQRMHVIFIRGSDLQGGRSRYAIGRRQTAKAIFQLFRRCLRHQENMMSNTSSLAVRPSKLALAHVKVRARTSILIVGNSAKTRGSFLEAGSRSEGMRSSTGALTEVRSDIGPCRTSPRPMSLMTVPSALITATSTETSESCPQAITSCTCLEGRRSCRIGSSSGLSNQGCQERHPRLAPHLLTLLLTTPSIGAVVEDPGTPRRDAEGHWDPAFRSPHIKLCNFGQVSPTSGQRAPFSC